MTVAGLALLAGALMVSIFVGGRYLLEMDSENNEVPITNLTGLGKDNILRMMSGKLPFKNPLNPLPKIF